MTKESEFGNRKRQLRASMSAWCVEITNDMKTGGNRVLSTSEINHHIYGVKNALRKEWQKPLQCYYPNCHNKSIVRSHTIPQGTLSEISYNGHLLSPQYSIGDNKILLSSIGLANASTFPGYCEKHESVFWGFETRKVITHPFEILLQIQRTIARELARLDNNYIIIKQKVDEYDVFLKNRLAGLFQDKWSTTISEFPGIEESFFILYNVDNPLRNRLNTISNLCENVKTFLEQIVNPQLSSQDITKHDIQQQIYLAEFTIEKKLPIALSGIAESVYPSESGLKKGFYFLSVLPRQESTHIIIHGPKEFSELAQQELDKFYDANRPDTMQHFIEHFSILHTDHWFLSPNNLSNEIKKERFLSLLNANCTGLELSDLTGFLTI